MMPIDGRGLPCLIAQALIQTFQKLKFSHEPVKLCIPSTIKHWLCICSDSYNWLLLFSLFWSKRKHFTAKIDSFPTFQLYKYQQKIKVKSLIFFPTKNIKKPPLIVEHFGKIGKELALLWGPNLLKSNKSTRFIWVCIVPWTYNFDEPVKYKLRSS